jgi:hypothetical protein
LLVLVRVRRPTPVRRGGISTFGGKRKRKRKRKRKSKSKSKSKRRAVSRWIA